MIRRFLSATLFAVAERVAPKPKVHPWPFALGAGFTVLGALWLWLLNEEAKVARAKDAGTTAAILGHRTRLNAIEAERFDLRGRGEVVRARVAAIEEALTMPDDGEAFACFQRRAPRSRAASAAWWKEPVPGAVWTAETGRWVLAGEVRGFQRAEAERRGDTTGSDAVRHPERLDVRHDQIRKSVPNCVHPRVVRVVPFIAGRLPHPLFAVRVARGENIPDHGADGPWSAEDITRSWPIVVDVSNLTAAERMACGLPPIDAPSACPSGNCAGEG